MPKVSKATKKRSASTVVEPVSKLRFKCCCCGTEYAKQVQNFPASQSFLYRGNNGYLPICNHCIEGVFMKYLEMFEDEVKAATRTCQKFDIYWNTEIYEMVKRINPSMFSISTYISKTNLKKYIGKTYDDTLGESQEHTSAADVLVDDKYTDDLEAKITPEMKRFWGKGFDAEFYLDVEDRYKKWTEDLPEKIDSGAEALYKQICMLEVIISRDVAEGKSSDKNVAQLNNLIASVNRKPAQMSQESATDVMFDKQPFGVGIKIYENTRPIPKPDPEFDDVDGIAKKFSVWVLGHLCKMLKLKNTNIKLYEEELEKRKVELPELEGEDDETAFNEIFGDKDNED